MNNDLENLFGDGNPVAVVGTVKAPMTLNLLPEGCLVVSSSSHRRGFRKRGNDTRSENTK